MVKKERQMLPRSGGRKMLHLISASLLQEGIKIGRDRFFDVLRSKGMLIKPRRKLPRTTYSKHGYAVAPNRFRELEIHGPGQAIVADITYIRVKKGFAYLFLATDAYSRKIVGWKLSSNLCHDGAVDVLSQSRLCYSACNGLVHHSDRGCQYCCHDFLRELEKSGMRASMTDENHCAQNSKAERINGILKDEFYLDQKFLSFRQAGTAVKNAIGLYNTHRPHLSLDYKTPDQIHYADYVGTPEA